MNIKSISALSAMFACLCGLAGCAAASADAPFPSPDTATTKEGSFPNLDNLRKVAAGETKNQIVELLGPPHFHEGVFHVRVWNYLLNLPNAGRVVTCQYQVQFDDDNRVSKTRWKDPSCEALAGEKTVTDYPAPTPAHAGIVAE